jgi:hypothetical protein
VRAKRQLKKFQGRKIVAMTRIVKRKHSHRFHGFSLRRRKGKSVPIAVIRGWILEEESKDRHTERQSANQTGTDRNPTRFTHLDYVDDEIVGGL